MEWYLPLLFWLAGTATAVFVRPRSGAWGALIALWFNTAIWLSAGFPSFARMGYSAVVFHAFIWPSAPLLLHVHLELPRSLGSARMRRAVLRGAYALAAALAVLDYFRLIPSRWFFPWLAAGIGASMAIMVYRLMRSRGRELDVSTRLMELGAVLGWGPIMLDVVAAVVAPDKYIEIWTSRPFFFSFALLFPLWPLSYFYALYRHRAGTVGYRANRVVGTYAFVALFVAAYLTASAIAVGVFGTSPFATNLILSVAFITIAIPLRSPFQAYVDRVVFGIKYDPNDVLSVFAQRIPSSTSRESLGKVVIDEILPTLMVRESALYVFDESGPVMLYEHGLEEPVARLHSAESPTLFAAGDHDGPRDRRFSWVRVTIPLELHDTQVGVWLLGRRDPDDFYPKGDVELFKSLANQIASVLQTLRLLETTRRDRDLKDRLNAALRQSTAELEARNAELEQFTHTVSHDLKTPLVTINGFLGALENDIALGDTVRVQRDLERIQSATGVMRRLLEGLLQLARSGHTIDVNGEVSVDDVVREAAALRSATIAERGITLRIADMPPTNADPSRLTELFGNLLDNAIKFIGDEPAPLIEIGSRGGDGEGVYFVRDNGVGIDGKYQEKVFGLFERLDPSIEGTGIGLALARRIVEAHHGRIWIESPGTGKGTSICFTLRTDRELGETDNDR